MNKPKTRTIKTFYCRYCGKYQTSTKRGIYCSDKCCKKGIKERNNYYGRKSHNALMILRNKHLEEFKGIRTGLMNDYKNQKEVNK